MMIKAAKFTPVEEVKISYDLTAQWQLTITYLQVG